MEALPYFNMALDIRERAYGPDHPDVSAAQISLAELLRDLGKSVTRSRHAATKIIASTRCCTHVV